MSQAAEFFGKLLFDDTEGWPMTDAGYQSSPSCIIDLSRAYRHPNGRSRLVLVDMIALERANQEEEHVHKDVLGRILNAPHILKVVHFLERTALRALQLAFVTEDVRAGPTKPESYISIGPCADVALVVACLQGTSAVQCIDLFSLVWEFMRSDMCMSEGLSNFERRPLRKTQEHDALCLAWCPLALLRALCSFGQAQWFTVLRLCMKILAAMAIERG